MLAFICLHKERTATRQTCLFTTDRNKPKSDDNTVITSPVHNCSVSPGIFLSSISVYIPPGNLAQAHHS